MTDKANPLAELILRTANETAARAARQVNADALATLTDRMVTITTHQAVKLAEAEATIAALSDDLRATAQRAADLENERDELLEWKRARLEAEAEETWTAPEGFEALGGQALDAYGASLGVPRNHQEDEPYRERVEAEILRRTEQQREDEREIAEEIECCADENA